MDVCESRWDDRRHRGENPLRTSRGRPHKPYHDVQAYVAGSDVTAALADLFWDRWRGAGGGDRPVLAPASEVPVRPRGLLVLGAAQVALSRTQPSAEGEGVREVEALFTDAIGAAERLIFIETQYFSSRRIREALIERMARTDRPRLEIVVLVNERAEALKEELAVGLRQAQNLEQLRRSAAPSGHRLGLYYSICDGVTEAFRNTYLHSKLLAIDDRFLTVGSANLTNRSMGTDSELHVSWEANGSDRDNRRLARAIRRVRVSLLAEHAGLGGIRAVRSIARIGGLAERLDELAARPGARLQRHGPPTPIQAAAMKVADPEVLPFDPDTSPEREADEPVDELHGDLLASATETFTALRNYLRRPWN
jgi:phosphatidylserine/phosphatidylglycerophosphate/cardiolipin synthase-like enzyme